MTNTINLLKGFAFAIFGFLGIHINIEAEMLHIMEKEGKAYVIETFKSIVDSFLKKFGYEKSEKNN